MRLKVPELLMTATISPICAAALLSVTVVPARAHESAHAPATQNSDVTTEPAARSAAHNRWGANYFPNVPLTTHEGKTIRFYDDVLRGKSVAIHVMFTACTDVCPLETANLVKLRKNLGDRVGRDIFFYSISIDPERDTPAVLKTYAKKFGAGGPGWHFLTGKPEDIKLVSQKLGLIRARQDPTSRDTHHTATLMIGDEPTGQWTRHSAVDNPQFMAARIGTFLGWRDTQPQKSYAEARPLMLENGERLFLSKCSTCHTLGKDGDLGPDLLGVTARREREWLTRYIQEPDKMLAVRDPTATALFQKYKEVRMPNLLLGSSDVADLISFLEARSKATIK